MQAEVSVHGLPGLNQQLLQHLLSQQYAPSQQCSVPTRSSSMLHNPGSPSSISTAESFPSLANGSEPMQHASNKSQQTPSAEILVIPFYTKLSQPQLLLSAQSSTRRQYLASCQLTCKVHSMFCIFVVAWHNAMMVTVAWHDGYCTVARHDG